MGRQSSRGGKSGSGAALIVLVGMILFEKDRWSLDSLWSAHPPLEERIKRLRAMR